MVTVSGLGVTWLGLGVAWFVVAGLVLGVEEIVVVTVARLEAAVGLGVGLWLVPWLVLEVGSCCTPEPDVGLVPGVPWLVLEVWILKVVVCIVCVPSGDVVVDSDTGSKHEGSMYKSLPAPPMNAL